MHITASAARERVLAAAEQLFAQKGYGSVTLRQIAALAGINHSSLYHHAPGGKHDLFVEVMERIFARHRAGLTAAIAACPRGVRPQLYAAAEWLLAQPPVDLVRMAHIDLPELSPEQAHRLTEGAYAALQQPIIAALAAARDRGEIAHDDLDLVSGGLVGMIQSLHAVSEQVAGTPRLMMARRLLDAFLDGLRPRRA